MSKSTRSIEVIRCWDDRTWDTDVIEIPIQTSDQHLAGVAETECLSQLCANGANDLPIYVGVYCTMDDNDELEELEDEGQNA